MVSYSPFLGPLWEAIRRIVAARLASKDVKTKPFSDSASQGVLWVVATPIGDLMDITLKALWILAGVDVIACENTRVSRKLLTHYGIQRPLVVYNDHNAKTMTPRLLECLQQGQKIALISDAGTPMLSDPGHTIVQAAWQNGIQVRCAPGVSALGAALMITGAIKNQFSFVGFLPNRGRKRKQSLVALKQLSESLVLYEAPHRLYMTLQDLYEHLGDRTCIICRELTKIYQSIYHTTLKDVVKEKAVPEKGEIVLIIGPGETKEDKKDRIELDDPIIAHVAKTLLKQQRPTQVAKWLGHLLHRSHKEVYKQLLSIKKKEI